MIPITRHELLFLRMPILAEFLNGCVSFMKDVCV
jgi:hypothetical protein